MDRWVKNINNLQSLLTSMSVQNDHGREVSIDNGFVLWLEMTESIRSEEKGLFFVGNGASSSMASHFATDIAKSCGLRSQVFSDSSLLTAVSNDLRFEEVFAEPLRWHMKTGDMLVAISSSGNSPNIIRAVETAKELGGRVVTLSAMDQENVLRKEGELNFYVAGQTYGQAETAHAVILHHWMDLAAQMG
ncbi:MAG: SIS domain-containing protein [Deltaproteobacteria bacterium]|nr:SIS domain-containing protein [Deltaproteobacteria bacterium]